MYKVCWPIPSDESAGYTCMDDDMLAAIDDAIADGVQVISVSIGTNTSQPYTGDGIAIGALHAVKRNIVVVCSAGNSGPAASTVTNVAPWIMTVGASSIDRVFSSPLVLGNGQVLEVCIIYVSIFIILLFSTLKIVKNKHNYLFFFRGNQLLHFKGGRILLFMQHLQKSQAPLQISQTGRGRTQV